MISKDELDVAVSRVIAEKIIAGLDDGQRAEFLTRAVTNALKDYQVKGAIEKAVADKALVVATKLLEQDEWTAQITAAIEAGFAKYIAAMPQAVADAMVEMMHGSNATSYQSVGLIKKHLAIKARDE